MREFTIKVTANRVQRVTATYKISAANEAEARTRAVFHARGDVGLVSLERGPSIREIALEIMGVDYAEENRT